MAYDYDTQNIFACILRGEIPNDTVLESKHCLVFRDINPQAPDHVLVIPRGPYVNADHFAAEASDAEIVDFTRTVGKVCTELGVAPEQSGDGYRLIANTGVNGVQDVPHMHLHILAGRPLGTMLKPG